MTLLWRVVDCFHVLLLWRKSSTATEQSITSPKVAISTNGVEGPRLIITHLTLRITHLFVFSSLILDCRTSKLTDRRRGKARCNQTASSASPSPPCSASFFGPRKDMIPNTSSPEAMVTQVMPEIRAGVRTSSLTLAEFEVAVPRWFIPATPNTMIAATVNQSRGFFSVGVFIMWSLSAERFG